VTDLRVIDGAKRDTPEPSRFFQAGKFVPAILGAFVRKAHGIRAAEGERLVVYRAGCYVNDEAGIRDLIRRYLGTTYTTGRRDQTLGWLKDHLAEVPLNPPTDTLNVANGLLAWQTGRLREHAPTFLSSVQIPHRWDTEATCPAVERFLGEVLPADALEFAWELLGYALYAGNPLHAGLLLYGPGASGKSTVVALFRALAGATNSVAVPLQDLSERFGMTRVAGKLLIFFADLDARAIESPGKIKAMMGGDIVSAEVKYGGCFEFLPICFPVFSANELPPSRDTSSAWFRRWHVVEMQHAIPAQDRDPHLLAKLTTREELEGLLVRAVHGLRALMRRGHFEVPESVRAAGQRYRDSACTVRAFLEDEADIGNLESFTARKLIYSAYSEWCSDTGRRPLSASRMYERLRAVPGVHEHKTDGLRGFHGLQLRGATR